MKASEFITEIEKLAPGHYTGGSEYLRREKHKNQLHPLPGGSGLQYVIDKDPYSAEKILIIDPSAPAEPEEQPSRFWGEPDDRYQARLEMWKKKNQTQTMGLVVGKLTLDKAKIPFGINRPVRQVGTITVHEKYRGIGLAKALYGIALSIMKVILVAGDSQTPGGRRNWVSLSSIPGVEVKGYVRIDKDFVTPKHWDYKPKSNDHLMNLGGQYLGTYQGDEYWAFDVVPGAKGAELAPAVKNALSKHLYKADYSISTYAYAGLYAIWTGK